MEVNKMTYGHTMDPIWRNLPYELVLKICNMLPRLRAIPLPLKNEIEFEEHMLLRIYRASAALFHWPWTDVYNSLAVYNLRNWNLTALEEGWNAEVSARRLWGNMTHDERVQFNRTWFKLVNVSQSIPSINPF